MKAFDPTKLRQAMQDADDMKAPALAIALGVNQVTVYRWLNGESRPNANDVANVAALLGKPMDFFFRDQRPQVVATQ